MAEPMWKKKFQCTICERTLGYNRLTNHMEKLHNEKVNRDIQRLIEEKLEIPVLPVLPAVEDEWKAYLKSLRTMRRNVE